ncbi:unnamed protein product [Lupinus luteus]|uniref:Polygalacturonase n=1 Tax=Lupinus luteus TaxID=3873 RepID=A0AAV1XS21_LUPLU
MQGVLISCLLILSFVSPCLCFRWSNFGLETEESTYNVLDYGAYGDGKSDDQDLSGDIVAAGMNEWGEDKLHLITVSNVSSLTIDGGGSIDGNGITWWEPCKDCQRPCILYFYGCKDLSVSSLTVANSPGFHIPINRSENVKFINMTVTAPGNSHNTDAFDLWDTKNVVFEDSITAVGDDCIAIKANCSYINYAPGYARKISFEDIILINTENTIIIDQHYGTRNTHKDATSMPVSDVTYRGFKGTSHDERAINLNCSINGCYNIILDEINIVSLDPKKKAQAFVTNAHGKVHNVSPEVSGMLE